jgi:hypothetical protein
MTVTNTLAYYKSSNQPKSIVGQFESYTVFVTMKKILTTMKKKQHTGNSLRLNCMTFSNTLAYFNLSNTTLINGWAI